MAGAGTPYSKIRLPDYDKSAPHSFNQALMKRCEKDLLFLSRDILGYKFDQASREGIADPPDLVHEEMAKLLAREERFKLGIFPRFTYKTTLITICDTIRAILADHNEKVLIATESWQYSRKVLREIKYHLQHNETLIRLYGKFAPEKSNQQTLTWNRDWVDILQRDGLSKEPTISTCGVGTEITGIHPTLIKADDVIGPKNITTADQKQKVQDWFHELLPILGSRGRLHVVGTPWDFDDFYSYMMENWLKKKDGNGNALFAFRKMGLRNLELDVESIMPHKFGQAEIDQLYHTMPLDEFAKQIMCDPRAKGNTLLNLEDILQYGRLPVKKEDKWEAYMAIDPGISLQRQKCWTGITVGIPLDPFYLYVDTAIREKLLPSQLIDKVMDTIDAYQGKIRRIGVETQAFQKIYEGSLLNAIRERMYANPSYHNVQVVDLKADNKPFRIAAIEPYFRHHQVYVKETLKDLHYQLSHYPHLSETNLDLIDSLSYLIRILPPQYLRNPYGIVAPSKEQGKNGGHGNKKEMAVVRAGEEILPYSQREQAESW